jgi:glutaredoxin
MGMTENETTSEKIAEHKEQTRREIRRTHIFIWILFGISAALAIFIYVQGLPPPPGKYDALAKCIAQTSTTFYGAFWCPDCAAQKTKFGTGARYLPYHECSLPDKSENDSCKSVGVAHYPTWVFSDGSHVVGVQSPAALAKKTGCAMPSST